MVTLLVGRLEYGKDSEGGEERNLDKGGDRLRAVSWLTRVKLQAGSPLRGPRVGTRRARVLGLNLTFF
jgi:hypothetical protein